MTVKITDIDGKKPSFTQWDVDRVLLISGVASQPALHFANHELRRAIVVLAEEDGDHWKCAVPNFVLQFAGPMAVSVFLQPDDDEGKTVYTAVYNVMPKLKPQDYSYTENIGYINWVVKSEEVQDLIDTIQTMLDNGELKGDPFTYEDFTADQLAALKGDDGNPGVYVGDTEPTDPGISVWIDTSGDADQPPIPAKATVLPADLGTPAIGSSDKYAAEDHVHKMPSATDVGALPADTQVPSKVSDLQNDSGFTTHGIPAGGSTGQVLKKASGADHDVEWADEEGGGTITVDDEFSSESENPVQNKVIRTALENKADVMAESFTVSGNNVSLARSFSYVISHPNNVYRFYSSSGSLIEMGYFHLSAFNFVDIPYTVTLTGIVDGEVYDIVLEGATVGTNPMTGTITKRGGSSVTVDDALSSTSENPVQNKVIKAALDAKGTYSKPSGGIPASDLASGVIPTVPTKTSDLTNDSGFLTAHQSLSAYRTSAAQDTIDAGKITAPSSPATGAFLVWNGSAWTAQTLAAWQGGSY